MAYGYRELNSTIRSWMADNSCRFYKKMSRSFESLNVEDSFSIDNWDSLDPFLDNLATVGQEIAQVIRRATYEYESLSEEELLSFTNLWYLMVSVQYHGLMPSAFFKAVKQIVVR